MSAFLGPIHHWLYSKIQVQEDLTARIAEESVKRGWLAEEETSQYVHEEDRPLEEMIDISNIHGWLQGCIHDAEHRYAGLLSKILEKDPERQKTILEIAESFGQERALSENSTAEEIYKAFEDTFVNGMPCDRVNVVTSQNEEAFCWEQTADLHGDLFEAAGLSGELYDLIRRRVMQGMTEKTAFSLQCEDGVHYMLKKAA